MQSNMEYPMADAFNGSAEREASGYPSLRMLNLADRPWGPTSPAGKNDTASDCPSKAPYIWAPSKPSTITPRSGSAHRLGDGPTDFSDKYPAAVCWFSARELVRAQPSVPVGIPGEPTDARGARV